MKLTRIKFKLLLDNWIKLINKEIEIDGMWQLISKYRNGAHGLNLVSDQSKWCLEDEFWRVIRLEQYIFLFLYSNKVKIKIQIIILKYRTV